MADYTALSALSISQPMKALRGELKPCTIYRDLAGLSHVQLIHLWTPTQHVAQAQAMSVAISPSWDGLAGYGCPDDLTKFSAHT